MVEFLFVILYYRILHVNLFLLQGTAKTSDTPQPKKVIGFSFIKHAGFRSKSFDM